MPPTPTDTGVSDQQALMLYTPAPSLEAVIDDKYEVLRPLGQGGFAWVFLARHRKIRRLKVAVKVLKPEHLKDKRIVRRFRREAEAAATLKHRHVVGVMDYGETEAGYPYIVMEYVDGVSLRSAMSEIGRLRTEDVIRWTRQMLLALEHAHESGIVHRDLKPDNIYLVDEAGEDHPFARVLDFGIADIVSGDPESTVATEQATVDGFAMCTPRYAAPELIQGESGPHSDLYTLGHIMAEMIEGKAPFEGSNAFMIAARHLADEPVPLSERVKANPLGPIIEKAVRKHVEDRYHCARDMIQDLDAAIEEARIDILATEPVDLSLLIEQMRNAFAIEVDQKTGTWKTSDLTGEGPKTGDFPVLRPATTTSRRVAIDAPVDETGPSPLGIISPSTGPVMASARPVSDSFEVVDPQPKRNTTLPIILALLLLGAIAGVAILVVSPGADDEPVVTSSGDEELEGTDPEDDETVGLATAETNENAGEPPAQVVEGSAPVDPELVAFATDVARGHVDTALNPYWVEIDSPSPGARVYLGDTDLGAAPIRKLIARPDAPARVSVRAGGFQPMEQTVQAGEPIRMNAALQPVVARTQTTRQTEATPRRDEPREEPEADTAEASSEQSTETNEAPSNEPNPFGNVGVLPR